MKYNKTLNFLLIIVFGLISGCYSKSSLSVSRTSLSTDNGVSIREKKAITFSVVPPDIADINSQEEIVPLLKIENNRKIALPTDVPIYTRFGQQVDVSYIGLYGYSVDIVCESFENQTFVKAEKIIVNQTHEEVDPYFYYYCDVYSFGNYFYFTVDTKGKAKSLDGNYILDFEWEYPYYHLLAGRPTIGPTNHEAYLEYLQLESGEIKGVQRWDYGPIIFE